MLFRSVDPDLKIIAAPCVYEPKAQLDLFAHLLEECDVLANSLPDDEKSQLLPQATALSNMLLQAYKHMYLSPERECRYVYMEHDGQSYPRLFAPRPDLRGLPLARAGSDSPYVRIVTGPRMTDSFAVDLRAQLSAVGYQHIPLETSRVDVATLSRLGGPRT